MQHRFGRTFLEHWPLDPDGIYLNHGTVGVTPLRVMQARQSILLEVERHPARFMLRELWVLGEQPASSTRLRAAAETVARFLGARGDGLVFVDNATTGVNAVLRALKLQPGDEVLIHDQAYGGVVRAASFIARERGAKVVSAAVPFPATDAAACVDAVARAITPRTRVAILDHICSDTALVLPVAEMAAACRTRGVPVLVDGAHAPGAIELDIESLGVDWYAGNLHKWAFAPRGCGVLWAAPERRAGLHPTVISWGVDQDDWLQEFDWPGTRDPSSFLAAPAGIEFMTGFLGLAAMREYNHALAWRSALALAERWRLPWATPETMVGCMVTVPLPERLGHEDAQAKRLRAWLLAECRIEAKVIARNGRLWVRICAQVYNDDSDIEQLARAIDDAR